MAAVDYNTYDMKEFRFALIPEAFVGTKVSSSMKLLQLTGDIGIAKEVVRDTTQRSGVGRTSKLLDVHTSDKGGVRTTITVPCVLDTTNDTMLHEGVTWKATDTSPAAIEIAFDHATSAIGHGAAPSTANAGSFTCALISPISNKTRYFVGCGIESMTVVMDAATDGGRRTATLTIVTEYYEAAATTDPTVSAYPAAYRYLYDYNAKFTVGGDTLISNKIEYTISSPVSYGGFQGSNGDPQYIQKDVNGGRIEPSLTLGLKYDANTEPYWSDFRNGTTISIEISNNATWASSTFGIKAEYCKLSEMPNPGDTEEGAFMDCVFSIHASTSGNMLAIVP